MVENTVLQIIELSKPIPVPVTMESNLYTDLGFDSLSFIVLLLEIEDTFSISFNVLEMENCLRVSQLIKLIKSKIEEGAK